VVLFLLTAAGRDAQFFFLSHVMGLIVKKFQKIKATEWEWGLLVYSVMTDGAGWRQQT